LAGEWFYAQDNRQLGPVTIEALVDMIRRGAVQPTDLVWTEHMPDWRAALNVPELMPGSPARVGMPGLSEAVPAGTNASLNYFSPTGLYQGPGYAGFWMRFAAAFIDGIILWVPWTALEVGGGLQRTVFGPARYFNNSPVFAVAALCLAMAKLALPWLYFAIMESSRLQATPGKLALGIMVTDLGGGRIGFGRATGRYFGKWISYITLFIGFMMAGWTRQKQALHDMMAGCLVVRKP
jgi:uncharacterized RDD family membrane protein YckC